MLHTVVFHEGLYCLRRQDRSSQKEIQYCLEIKTYDPSIYTIDHPDIIVCTSFMDNSIGLIRVNKSGMMIYLLLLVFIRNSAGAGDIFAYEVNRAPVRATCTLLNHVAG